MLKTVREAYALLGADYLCSYHVSYARQAV
jgi:hypothetical protein